MVDAQLRGFASYTRSETVEDYVRQFLQEFEDSYDVQGLADALRDAINEQLADHRLKLIGNDLYGTHPVPQDSAQLIGDAVEAVDLMALAEDFEVTT